MNIIDPKELIEMLGFREILCKEFSKKLNKSEEELNELFDHIIDKEINNIGETFTNKHLDRKTTSRLRGLSLDDFMKDNDKIIKDK